jgi:hypothetical protein
MEGMRKHLSFNLKTAVAHTKPEHKENQMPMRADDYTLYGRPGFKINLLIFPEFPAFFAVNRFFQVQ